MTANAPDVHYAILTAMLAPAFFLTATASLLLSANNRLARVIDRARVLLKELAETEDAEERELIERHILRQKKRSRIILRGSQLLYTAISFFVGTSLTVAGDAVLGYRLGLVPTVLAALGVLSMFAASLLLARESSLAVEAVNEEMDHGHASAVKRWAQPPRR
ncbi:DUF2721 domain-containing protein [Lysobacter sp. K5869]|uniref:DUF2721 domain-containing protein n=1 Tax=Lysobacter sp. K5869 TaxID=2820808 RepID=UPI001C05F0F3|nr:DUF2721 domain-containing protein [Lysobacter sp. K5869]QWP75045.1 DUF2721 domain-containing protein [Lysobacter sp. K5869]